MALALALYTFDQYGYLARLRMPKAEPTFHVEHDPHQDREILVPATPSAQSGGMGWLPESETW